ncbi:MATERNAL EFFECT EMBRYO ARREST 46, EMBRYO SAC DEVELOPMENT ARREST 8 [Hibiscus trionum]|uniref:MATERNAL EFFECT EMBRYO ARREST 46, EMBRYO SAC DEVELOPMENT ARREST 8 n=1 Tax=Hibiscus trionum TaxID=183268 RepID=A0A9W7HEM8_HIBTR|nr:MATERNAL EFFECT EMBRYO ARREST 46, EMBRYO SAC DEVELOPMENT ARREST 8 [Hibiscus trionum]
MRIRKNKKLSSLLFPQGSRPDGIHVCRLNQSTWDVVPLSPEPQRFEYEDSFNGNGSTGDSIGAVESVATMVGSKEEAIMKVGGMVIDENDDNNEIKTAEQFEFESQCEEEEEDKESNQEPALLKSCSNNSSNGGDSGNNINPGKKAENYNNQPTESRRGRARTSRRGSSSGSNPYEFYYYSGFGPSWGKKRRGGDKVKGINKNLHIESEEVETNGSVITAQNNSALSSSSQIDDNEEFDYEEEEEEDGENGDSGKKRMRKPIKARSLKSLM